LKEKRKKEKTALNEFFKTEAILHGYSCILTIFYIKMFI